MAPASSTWHSICPLFLQAQQEAHIKAACFQSLSRRSYQYKALWDINYQWRDQEKKGFNTQPMCSGSEEQENVCFTQSKCRAAAPSPSHRTSGVNPAGSHSQVQTLPNASLTSTLWEACLD